MRKLVLLSFLVSLMGCMAEVGDEGREPYADETEAAASDVALESTSEELSIGGFSGGGGLGNQRTCPVGSCYTDCDNNFLLDCPSENSESTCARRWRNCVGVCNQMKACRLIDL